MPVFRYRVIFDLIRGAKAFLNLEGGITRGAVPPAIVADANRRLAEVVTPENIVWILGTGRSGSTWLAAMMEEPEGHHVWFEPRVGTFFDPQKFERYEGSHFVFGAQYRDVWLASIRNLILDGANARFPDMADGGYLMIKEPGGSVGAQVIMEALPESRMVLLIRDPRDVVASWLDAARKGGWQNQRRSKSGRAAEPLAETNPEAFIRQRAETYLRHVGNAKKAYDAHRGRKTVVRYEDLRVDTLNVIKRMYAVLDIPVDQKRLAQAVEKHSWENVPGKRKGKGKFYRKAMPGGWREDLTPEQVKEIEQITGHLLKEFYPG